LAGFRQWPVTRNRCSIPCWAPHHGYQRECRGYDWAFADQVSSSMKAIYDNTAVVRTKVLALRSLMTAADKLGRHAPQKLFSGYLEGIKTIDLALPVAEMISEHATPDVKKFKWINIEGYHPAIKEALKGFRIKPYEEEDMEGMEPPNALDPGDPDNHAKTV